MNTSVRGVEVKEVDKLAVTGLPCFVYHDPYHERFVNYIRLLLAQNLSVLARLHPGWDYPAEEDILRKEIDRSLWLWDWKETVRVVSRHRIAAAEQVLV